MGNQTKPVTIRISENMANSIDSIVNEKRYSNKPDYILYSLRSYYDYAVFIINKTFVDFDRLVKQENIPLEEIDYNIFMKYLLKDTSPSPSLWESKPLKTILIRIPIGFFDELTVLIKSTQVFSSIQDFTRYAIAYNYENDADKEYILEKYSESIKNKPDKEKTIILAKEFKESFVDAYKGVNWNRQ